MEMQGLQSLINGHYEEAFHTWTNCYTTSHPLPPADKAYYEEWIERAKGRAKGTGTTVNSQR
jgi:hypothetical protein